MNLSLWWIKELELRIKSKRYLKIELTISLFLILLLIVFWPDTKLNLKTFGIPNLSIFFFSIQSIIIFYLASLIASGNFLAEKEFRIFELAKYAPTNLWDIVLGKFFSIFFYLAFLLILLLPLNLLINFVSLPFNLRVHYYILLTLLDSIIYINLGILWSTIYNPGLNWTFHWITFLLLILIPFLFPPLSPYFPINNILWASMSKRFLSLDINFSLSHFIIILTSYTFLSLIFLFLSQKRLISWRKSNENFKRDK
jgi:ABC-type transport system involved in multi-copper enzyme maturation permease subunit